MLKCVDLNSYKLRLRGKSYNKQSEYKQLSGKDSDENDETELFVRNKTQFYEVPLVEKVVEDGDTLQALSIKYHCSVSIWFVKSITEK